MALGYKLKHYILSAFRELFIYHHSSLEFRAKVFAIVIAANEHSGDCELELVKKAGMAIYDDENRANTLMLTTMEYIKKVHDHNGLDIDLLAQDITNELKLIARYAEKIDVSQLKPFIQCSTDEDTIAYQMNIIEFLGRLKERHQSQQTSA